ncbi:hypothetical protein [Bdellovibrio svalbardensis]|uniref:Uncharacterized protein n=1 Tax=Bdellovibrio svalbardensis TaxID=2972972 RepID=A0ABT6DKZ3_9BACT|nr:hypothetical protein [Bdellovibrio svalbardensis]MDG0817326.1 hypothetical protein [Bdellovibrio svalbardensis]
MKFSISIIIILIGTTVLAQTQTKEQCIVTTKARAAMTLSSAQVERLCEENPMEVVNCAVTQLQGARFTTTLDKSIRQCRLEWTTTTVNGQGIF